jgi:hypothetical protein
MCSIIGGSSRGVNTPNAITENSVDGDSVLSSAVAPFMLHEAHPFLLIEYRLLLYSIRFSRPWRYVVTSRRLSVTIHMIPKCNEQILCSTTVESRMMLETQKPERFPKHRIKVALDACADQLESLDSTSRLWSMSSRRP